MVFESHPDLSHVHHQHGNGTGPNITHLPVQIISKLAPFSAVIISIVLIVYFILRFYVLEDLLPKLYGESFLRLSDRDRRGFLNHHIAGATKFLILLIAVYPFIYVTFCSGSYHTPVSGGSIVTMGDLLVVATQMLAAMYIFELLYRPSISIVSIFHHIGAILIAQAAIAISLDLVREKDATIEFALVTVWGAFDIVSELFPHGAIILYRVYPSRHTLLLKTFRFAFFLTFSSTIIETIVTMWLFGSLWHRWVLAFKVVTPLLHIIFSAAQLHGTRIFFLMWRKQVRLIAEAKASKKDEEKASIEGEEKVSIKGKEKPVV